MRRLLFALPRWHLVLISALIAPLAFNMTGFIAGAVFLGLAVWKGRQVGFRILPFEQVDQILLWLSVGISLLQLAVKYLMPMPGASWPSSLPDVVNLVAMGLLFGYDRWRFPRSKRP